MKIQLKVNKGNIDYSEVDKSNDPSKLFGSWLDIRERINKTSSMKLDISTCVDTSIKQSSIRLDRILQKKIHFPHKNDSNEGKNAVSILPH
jgi:hypothetical protein